MPSVKNPNGPSKNRLAARAAKTRKQAQKSSSDGRVRGGRVARADTTRGARTGLLPTSGPNAALSAKKRRKLERKMGYALKRKEGEVEVDEGEVAMKDVADAETGANKKQKRKQKDQEATTTATATNEVDMDDAIN